MKWTLKVKNFGRIKDAEVHDSDIRFIVGKNNSGKSYLMTLLWGMGKLNDDMSGFFNGRYPLNIDLSSWITAEQINSFEVNNEYAFNLKDYESLINHFVNACIEAYINDFIKTLFNYKEVKIDKMCLSIEFDENDIFKIKLYDTVDMFSVSINGKSYFTTFFGSGNERLDALRYELLDNVTQCLLYYLFRNKSADAHHIYLPSARTGYMLTKDIINKTARRSTFSLNEERYEPFTLPTLEFLDLINEFRADKNLNRDYEKICKYIEEDIIEGRLIINDLPNKPVTYLPKGSDTPLPLRMASAVVTEIAPLYLALKYRTGYKTIGSVFYEEPEMCLHLSLQREIARALVKLANTGINLTVTTHSDIIIQHINNMINLESNSRRKKYLSEYGYTRDDLITGLDIAMYQFEENGDGTVSLIELERGKFGFAIPTFNGALDSLAEENYASQKEVGED